jgi:hypothetical protein
LLLLLLLAAPSHHGKVHLMLQVLLSLLLSLLLLLLLLVAVVGDGICRASTAAEKRVAVSGAASEHACTADTAATAAAATAAASSMSAVLTSQSAMALARWRFQGCHFCCQPISMLTPHDHAKLTSLPGFRWLLLRLLYALLLLLLQGLYMQPKLVQSGAMRFVPCF